MDLSTYKLRQQESQQLGNKYFEVDLLYKDLCDLVNDEFKLWYCSRFYKLGRQKVIQLASEARVDGKDSKKLFSHLLRKS